MSTTRARDVHFVNKRLLADLLEGSVPAVVVLTDVDRAFLNLRGTVRREEASETAPQRGVGDSPSVATSSALLGRCSKKFDVNTTSTLPDASSGIARSVVATPDPDPATGTLGSRGLDDITRSCALRS